MTGSNKPRSALADGADLMARLARTLREQQLAERGAVRLPERDVYSMSPDEAWSKRFMSQGIGPTPDCVAPGGYCAMPFPLERPTAAMAPQPQAAMATETFAPVQAHSQIGLAIGKPLRRSFFRRALRGTP